MHKRLWATAMLILLVPSGGYAQIPPGFEVVHITDNPNDYSNRPQINNCGEIVFGSRINQSESGEEIFLYDNGRLIRLTNDNVRDAFPDINDDQTIVWTQEADGFGGGTIVMYRDGIVTEIATGTVGKINNLAHVAWIVFHSVGCASPSDIFLYDGEIIEQITNDALSNQVVAINDNDDLVWTRFDFCASPWESDVMLYSGGVITQLTDGQIEPGGASINDAGQIIWTSKDPDDFHRFVELSAGRITATVVDPASGWAINNGGEIVFHRWRPEASHPQLWLYRDGELLQLTDDLFHNWVADINDDGEIAWEAHVFPESDIHFLRRIRTGEADFDSDIDLDDLAMLQDCVTGPGDFDHLCTCRFFDVDHDRDVDLGDFAAFQRAFTGENG